MSDAALDPIGPDTLVVVTHAMRAERGELLELLSGLDAEDWTRPTECPAYPVKGIATHILGDDLSLLSRQRDGAMQGLILFAEHNPGLDFRALLDGFNDQWVEAARFLSPRLLLELLRLVGEESAAFYEEIDPMAPGEPVPLFSPPPGEGSPYWHAIVREYLERWTHHSQIRRALGLSSLADSPFLEVGARIVATVAALPASVPDVGDVTLGPLTLGSRAQAADLLTLAHHEDQAAALMGGPEDAVRALAARIARRPD
ncbi:MAG: maleylpyruvate isomerase family mycothiol-dependent enzyme [Acidimicrobiales bacterium]|nr:maleylpyruvate isomerase family mycothiol-dependent enzyme [Acidimicrobiales bacterium]